MSVQTWRRVLRASRAPGWRALRVSAFTASYLLCVLFAWWLAGVLDAPRASLGSQLLVWGVATVLFTDDVQDLVAGRSPHRRVVLRLVLISAALAVAAASTGLPFVYPFLAASLAAHVAQREPGPRTTATGVVTTVVGTLAVEGAVHAGWLWLTLPPALSHLAALVLLTLSLSVLLSVTRLAARERRAAAALAVEQRRRHDELLHAALHDPLTGLLNRRGAGEALSAAVRAASPREPAALVYLDLDGFKLVNDVHGHQAGDRLLVEVAARLAAAVPPGAALARTGGDEFVVVLRGPGAAAPAALAERLRASLTAPVALDGSGRTCGVGASTGTAVATGPVDPEDLVRRADAAMYEDKRRRRATAGTAVRLPG
ncbi:diguanylate cyclase domain-containing protein [Kineococcus sp. SYSU DK004]|uniref:diguanylate cyclase domain-containing protein n=1 Tax=Kineococcus sp. SYSU DK004 TaxID=3383125 RepID=UPI003D7E0A1E